MYTISVIFKCTGTSCTTGTGAVATKPFCGNSASALGTIPVNVGVCGQCQTNSAGGDNADGPSSCRKADASKCVQGTCDSGNVCCASGECATSNANCLI